MLESAELLLQDFNWLSAEMALKVCVCLYCELQYSIDASEIALSELAWILEEFWVQQHGTRHTGMQVLYTQLE